MHTIAVNGPSPYEVTLGTGLSTAMMERAATIGAAKVAIIHQPPLAQAASELVEQARIQGIEATAVAVPDAEAAKQLDVLARLWDIFGEAGFSRRDAVIGLGGGAVTDLAGFAGRRGCAVSR